ncbi:hypothetical protein AR1Y2_2510 [Anaerostipes rhamnosivorans]|uniref:Uncharacterized protein n=1 Tax=Anaerostipes rhamnosivorans TaxID=1229621 RepID=A0A4P8IJ45_9FIRM|nr:hypothetical protein AR1Y2_2510 [Anaerostipes rhamnosivorans]
MCALCPKGCFYYTGKFSELPCVIKVKPDTQLSSSLLYNKEKTMEEELWITK